MERQELLDAVAALGLPVMGRSRGGRSIFGGTAGDVGGRGRRLLVVGGIHGDEPASVEAVVELVGRLRGARAARGALVLPALNPDGLAAGRKNSDADVDLNRNFPARSFSSDHVPGYHPGPRPLSEPETELLAEVVHSGAIEAVLAVHAPFSCVNFDGPARRWAETVSAACGWPLRESIGYPTPGSLGSWLGVDRGLPILTLELPPGSLDGFRAAAAAALDAAVADVGD